jgi:hypothetical protein
MGGVIEARHAFTAIVGVHTEMGISLEDVLKINERTFGAKIKKNWDLSSPSHLGG